jgi:hypothetical protein
MSTTLFDNHPQHKRSIKTRIAVWLRGNTLARDITVALAIKLLLLVTLKFAFFNQPQAKHMSMPPAAVAQALFAVPASSASQGVQHAQQ